MLENNKNPRPASGRRKRGQTYEKSMEADFRQINAM